MTTVLTRCRKIAEREGFDIIVKKDGEPLPPKQNGTMGDGYDLYKRKLKGTKTVSAWKNERFEPTFPGLTCDVLTGTGEVAAGNRTLDSVRNSYE